MSDNTIDVYGKQVPTNLLLEYAYQIACGETGKARAEAHKSICEAVGEPYWAGMSKWTREKLGEFMLGYIMRPAVLHYLLGRGIDFNTALSNVNVQAMEIL